MAAYYLRVECVNLDNLVYDTNDLSTVRGGGLIALHLPGEVEKVLDENKIDFETIAIGASWGLFHVCCGDRELEGILEDINNKLSSQSSIYSAATWVLDAVEDSGDFMHDRNQVKAINRWRQMQSICLALPDPAKTAQPDVGGKAVCEVDFVRPAVRIQNNKAMSEHVFRRREHGRKQRQKFYEIFTGKNGLKFTNDLETLACADDSGCLKSELGNLDGKMAVVYLDGNGFGKIQQDRCGTREELMAFNKVITDGQKEFLVRLLEKIQDNPRWVNKRNGESLIRLETLLWGGDELMWVVPAWQGWWLLGYFFKHARWNFDGEELTHAAGLVFCHHKAPIHRIKNLAVELAHLAKQKGKHTGYVAYQVLESFDHTGTDLAGFRKLRCPAGISVGELIFPGKDMLQVLDLVKEIKNDQDFSRRKLHQIVDSAFMGESARMDKLIEKAGFDQMGPIQKLARIFGKAPVCYLHLLELWDYLAMEEN